MAKFINGLLGAAILISTSLPAWALQAPAGVRPCCAFGTDLKAELGWMPVPFFSLENVLSPDGLGKHIYNDGEQGVTGSLLGMSDEKNGLLYTHKGGFIDTAHVRDTADYTYYLYQKLWPEVGSSFTLDLPDELRHRQIVLHTDGQLRTEAEKRQQGIKLAGLMAFELAQWHEIAQWFGMTSVSGWSELASAFSPEDLYSNMLGAKLAMQVLQQQPKMDVAAFSYALQQALQQTLRQLDVVSKVATEQRIDALDGNWWDSHERLPNKWVLRKRDYNLALTRYPHGTTTGMPLQLQDSLLVELRLVPADSESSFAVLPEALKNQPYWTEQQFQTLANFARNQDLKLRPDADINQST
ncbi:membrane protein [Shewanella sp. NFH-SH190041]|uniref:DUF4056 domain-containing protein n=1 Tax=Shewanella sp. NFH-SH190041 TaxID=2950245 RepID=UPI0021C2A3B5|nr:DUF4056 domain-containing protein [Shewanella sp. NFH-SH190041]BDM65299.1 membrane protein [Shewanella sp. NFH-SH190041]